MYVEQNEAQKKTKEERENEAEAEALMKRNGHHAIFSRN
jgi:hypothetical protein